MSNIFTKLNKPIRDKILYFLQCSDESLTDSRQSDLPSLVRNFNGATVKIPEIGCRGFMFYTEEEREIWVEALGNLDK
ncbi:MAG TPA: hypothetical protein PKY82_34955, partial [Pyrinomonadaceae bacterium]|nr:hypothetical protein [Pyrinomonadaceae bacterium]